MRVLERKVFQVCRRGDDVSCSLSVCVCGGGDVMRSARAKTVSDVGTSCSPRRNYSPKKVVFAEDVIVVGESSSGSAPVRDRLLSNTEVYVKWWRGGLCSPLS